MDDCQGTKKGETRQQEMAALVRRRTEEEIIEEEVSLWNIDDANQDRLPDGTVLNEEGDETDHSEAEGEDDSPSQSKISVYGKPASADEIYAAFPSEDSIRGGLVWHARLCYGDAASIKSRRGTLDVHVVQFFKSLVRLDDGRWFFFGRSQRVAGNEIISSSFDHVPSQGQSAGVHDW